MVESERIKLLDSEIGKTYGDFKVIGYRHEKGKVDFLKCECMVCGAVRSKRYSQIGSAKCSHGVKNVYDERYIGQKKNSLTVTDFDGRKFTCRCDCGNVLQVFPADWNNGQIKSCGCLSENRKVEHNAKLDKLRTVRNHMMQRCYNENDTGYKDYGGRGISICQEWRDSFDAFAEWALSHGFKMNLTIDRIDNDGNYEPNNCRWVSMKTQVHNQRPKKGGIFYKGEYRSQKEIAKMLKIPLTTLNYHIKLGRDVEEVKMYVKNKHNNTTSR